MALRGYELLLFVRAQNQASATLRRVANDVNHLQRTTSKGVPLLQGAERLQAQGRLISHAGRTAQLAGLAAAVGLGAAAKSAADFNTEITLAASQARDLDAPLSNVAAKAEVVDDQIKGLMRDFPAASSEMTDSAYEIYSGINLFNGSLTDTERGLDAMTLANKAAVAGQADLADSTSLLITLANNFGDSSADMTKNMDTAFDIIRFGRLHVSELNDMMNKLAPAAKASSQNMEDLAGATAFLTTVIPSQRQVATGTARLLDQLRHPDMVAGLKEFGVEVQDSTGRMRPFMDIMQEIINTFPELQRGEVNATNFFRTISQRGRLARTGAPGLGIVSTIEGRRVFTQLVDGWDQVLERQRQITENTGELNKAYEALNESAGVRFRRFVNNLKADLLEIGAAAIPVFEQLGGYLRRVADWWENLDDSQRQNITRWAAFSSIALIVAGTVASLIGLIAAMAGSIGRLFGPRGINAGSIAMFGRFAGLLRVIKGVGTLATIGLVVNAAMTGDVTAIQLLEGLIAGAATGFAIGGPLGAIIGGITVPITMMVASEINKSEISYARKVVQRAWDDAGAKMGRGREHWINWDLVEQQALDKIKQMNLWGAFQQNTQEAWMRMATQAYEAGKVTAANFIAGMKLAGFSTEAIDAQLAKFTEAAGQNRTDPLHEHLAIVNHTITRERAVTVKQQTSQLKAWDKYFQDLAKYRNRDKDLAVRNADVVGDATKAAVDELAGFLINKYQEIENAHKQVMGSLFQGDWLTGERANISEEWGIKPMAADLLKDMQMQLNTFNRFNKSLSDIAKRGGPKELIDELRALGPAGMDQIEALRRASPKQFNQIVAAYKKRQNAIRQQTRIDFNKQLAEWRKHGGNMMKAIISGLDSEHAQLEQYFRKMATVWFPDFIAQSVREAQANAASNKPPGAKKPVAPSGVDPRHRDPTTGRKLTPVTVREGDISVTVYQQPGESSVDVHRRAANQLKAKVRAAKGKTQPTKPKKPKSSAGHRAPE